MNDVIDATLTLTLSRRYDAQPALVFDAWLTKEWGEWLGPPGFTCAQATIEARVGGRYELRMLSPDGNAAVISGVYREIARPHRLVFTWGGGGCQADETIITLSFVPDGTGTLMTLQQSGFTSAESRDRHDIGWNGPGASFDKLASCLAT